MSRLHLRDYQEDTVNSIFRTSSNVIVVLATGSGKSVGIAEVAVRYNLMGKKLTCSSR